MTDVRRCKSAPVTSERRPCKGVQDAVECFRCSSTGTNCVCTHCKFHVETNLSSILIYEFKKGFHYISG